ncbi:Mn-dependent DtxR family transcriptional regulator [Paenibacillus phyllosphaerae]|uniref:Mn-dependent DtxR family transcriptional regulator n=1 Tax=Paenibacillus phyllosphaerae TaxID=274593 RepID=A0A7W5B2U1_9BACL|nr:Mn-dependent DtxR family transcriptional regulator [Paenibacillus phyllosphaerae]
MKLERLIAMIYKLLNNEVISASTFAEEFQVSPRTSIEISTSSAPLAFRSSRIKE